MEDTNKSIYSRKNRAGEHINSQRGRQHAQGPLRSAPGGVFEKKKWSHDNPNPQGTFSLCSLENEKLVFFKGNRVETHHS